MSEILLNTDFSEGDFDHWDNGVNENAFIKYSLYECYASHYPPDLKKYDIKQDFLINEEVISASLTIYRRFVIPNGWGASVRAVINLEKPDTTEATILDQTFGPGLVYPYADYLLNNEDVIAHFDQYGTYKIWINIWIDPGTNHTTIVNIYYVNLDMVVKKTKSVHEKMGGSGSLGGKTRVSRSEIVGLSEAYSTEVLSYQRETASGIVGLSESLSAQVTRRPSVLEGAGLLERLQATRTQGNIITTFDISDLTDWNETGGVTTPWVKEKIEIN